MRFLAIVCLVVAFLFSGKIEAKISDNQFVEISSSLNIGADTVLSKYLENEIKSVLNKFIDEKDQSETTYGILIMASFDEAEFIDAILSQKFSERSKAYFKGVLDKRINLFKHWGKTGKSFMSVLKKGKSATPMTALALESVEIIDKTMAIFDEWEVLKNTKEYSGLWYYFDLRKNGNEPHSVAWKEAEEMMGWAAQDGNPFRTRAKQKESFSKQLEQQFASLYEKWGPYATPNGISKEYKKKLAGELRNTLAVAMEEENAIAKEESKPSLLDKLITQLEKIKSALASIAEKVNPFSAGPVLELVENSSLPTEPDPTPGVSSPTPGVNPDAEIMGIGDPLNQEEPEALAPEQELEEITEARPLYETTELVNSTLGVSSSTPSVKQSDVNPADDVDSTPGVSPSTPGVNPVEEIMGVEHPLLCQKVAGQPPKQYRALINEVAWMGSQNSSNDEWIELKNIFGIPLNIQGWQLQDKGQQIKKIFGENDAIPANGYLLLERSKDYTGALNNTDEALYLFDNNCQLEDEVLANPNWPAGDNTEKKTMQRFDAMSWYSQIATPKETNSYPPASLRSPSGSAITAPTPAPSAPAPETPSFIVLINEIAWAGTKANSADEWIELYNTANSAIDLTGWRLAAADGGPDITFTTSSIAAGAYFLIERTDDNTVSDIAADFIASFGNGLSNSGERLELRNTSGNLIDLVDNSSGWSAGQASPNYVSMERKSSSSWAGNNQVPWDGWIGKDALGDRVNGTPKTQNSVSKISTTVHTGGFSIDNNFVLPLAGSPYFMEGSIIVSAGAKLTIEPGVTIKFKHNGYSGSRLQVDGELEAVGGSASDQKITFTSSSTAPAIGDWEWLYLKGTKANLENVIIEYAGKREGNPPENPYYTKGEIFVESGDFTIKNSIVRSSQTLGIWMKTNTNGLIDGVEFSNIQESWTKPAAVYLENATTTVQNSTFQNNKTGVLIDSLAGAVGPIVRNNSFQNNEITIQTSTLLPDFSGNTAQNNTTNGILATNLGFTDSVNQINLQPGLDYIIEGQPTVPSGRTLNVQAGTNIKLKTGARIFVEGDLRAIGTESQKVTFTAYGTIWDYISFSASSTNSILDNVVVSKGGFLGTRGGVSAYDGAIKINGMNLVIKNSVMENNEVAMEFVNAGLSAQAENITVRNNKIGVYVTSGSCPNLSSVSFSSNQNYDIWPSACQ